MPAIKKALLVFVGFTLIGSGVLGPLGAQGENKDASDASRPIITEANTLELDNKNKTATFSGNVMAKQEQKGKEPLLIYCDKMVIYSSEETGKKPSSSRSQGNEKKNPAQQNQVEKIVASGRVRVFNDKDRATGDTAVFYNTDQRIILSGKAEFWQGKNLIKGEEITVWIKEDRALVTSKGSNRVRAVIYQEDKK
jgi:lipopolysaccharide export system protein LptA